MNTYPRKMRRHLRCEHLHVPLRQLVRLHAALQHHHELAGTGRVAQARELLNTTVPLSISWSMLRRFWAPSALRWA